MAPPPGRLRCAALLGVGLALAATGHAANAEPRLLTGAAVFLHGVSLAFWIGALVPLAFALAGPREPAIAALMGFSRWIPFAVAALLASGILLAVVQLSRVDALWTTDYGRVLTAKLALVLVLLAIALWNRLRLTPAIAQGADPPRRRMRRSIAAELVLVVAILGVVGLWRFTPPPRTLTAPGDEFFTHLHTEAAMANVTVIAGACRPGRHYGSAPDPGRTAAHRRRRRGDAVEPGARHRAGHRDRAAHGRWPVARDDGGAGGRALDAWAGHPGFGFRQDQHRGADPDQMNRPASAARRHGKA